MIMEIRVFGLVLLLVLSAALPAEAQTWKDFQRKHIYLNMPKTRCNRAIKERQVNYDGICRQKNSFITDEQVIKVCRGDGKRINDSDNFESKYGFNVVTCKIKNNASCSYQGSKCLMYVTVVCEDNVPVHYVTESPVRSCNAANVKSKCLVM